MNESTCHDGRMPEEGDSEVLPHGWVKTTLSEIRIDRSKTIDPRKLADEMFELYSVPSFSGGRPETVLGGTIGSSKRRVQSNSVLVCKINPRINRVWIVGDFSEYRKIASTEWLCFSEVRGLDPNYLCFYLQQDVFRDFLASNASGVGGSLMRVNNNTLADYPIVLPPHAEQRRIVAEIEKQFTRLDAAETGLSRVEAHLKRYRASVLKVACEGKLVPTEAELAEAEGRDYEHAEQLLERILVERRAWWESQVKKKGKYKKPASPDTNGLLDLPQGWVWASVDMLTQNYDKYRIPVKAKDRAKLRGPYPYYGASGKIDSVNDYLFDGTFLLIAEDGANLLARATPIAFVVGGQFWVNNHAHVVKTVGEMPLQYLGIYVNSLNIEQYVTGTAQPKLTQTAMNRIPVPLPPLAEQVRIVAEVERRLSLIQKAEATVEANLKKIQRLRQSILRQAFRGRLVPQHFDDEPACVLLERIRAERAAAKAATPYRKKSHRRTKSASDKQLPLLESEP